MFLAAGCAACHAARGAEAEEAPWLGGGRRLATAYGTFATPNISPDPEYGIGGDGSHLALSVRRADP